MNKHSFTQPATRLITVASMILAAILPLLVSFLLHVPRVALDNFTDAVFYLSYARQFGELVSRYGFIYYATRFGGILPDALSGHLFGEINGIWILRWGLSIAVSLTLFLFFRKRYGLLPGMIASLLWSLNPAALRLLCTTYVDSTAVPFLILGCVLFAAAGGNRLVCVLAGVLLGLAASAHLYAAFALFLLVPWMMGSLYENRAVLVRSFTWTSVGFLGTFLIGWLWYWVVWRMPALFGPTIELMRDLGGGQAALWKKPLITALRETPAWFAPFALLPALMLASIRENPLIRGAALSLLMSAGFFWGGDLFGNAYVLSMPFYYSFLIPVMTLSSATLCGELVARKEKCKSLIWLSVAGIALASILVGSTGKFAQMLGHYRAKDIPVIELASALSEELPKAQQDGKVMRFWYDDDLSKPGGSDRRMIGAFWLHTFVKLLGEKELYVSFPIMSPGDAETIRSSEVNRIVIFDQDPMLVNRALEEIKTQKLPYTISKMTTLTALSDSKRTLSVAVLERNHPLITEVSSVDFKGWNAYHNGKILSQTSTGTDLMSGKIKWWDFAELPIGSMKKGTSIVISCRVESGMIRFALHEGTGGILEQTEMWLTKNIQELILTAPCDIKDAVLTLHSMYPRGSQSQVFIEKVEKDELPIAP